MKIIGLANLLAFTEVLAMQASVGAVSDCCSAGESPCNRSASSTDSHQSAHVVTVGADCIRPGACNAPLRSEREVRQLATGCSHPTDKKMDESQAASQAQPQTAAQTAPQAPATDETEATSASNCEKQASAGTDQELSARRSLLSVPPGTVIAVSLQSPLSSKTASTGKPVSATLSFDLNVDGEQIAPAGSQLTGYVTDSQVARRLLKAKLTPHRWLQSGGALSLKFDKIVSPDGKTIDIDAEPLPGSSVCRSGKSRNWLAVNRHGQFSPSISTTLTDEAKPLLVTGLAFGSKFLWPFAPPAVGAVAGAVKPDLVLQNTGERHSYARLTRLKGMALGALSGIPGGTLIKQAVLRGQEVVLQPNDELMLRVKDGKTASAAVMSPAS